jgi:hypothetical protein
MKHNSGVHNKPIDAPNPLVAKHTSGSRSSLSKNLIYNKPINTKWAEINIY